MSAAASLVFYITFFLLSVMFIYLGNKDKAKRLKISLGIHQVVINPLLVIGVAIPVIVAGLRKDVGTDFGSYLTEYNTAIQTGSYLEPGFNIIANASNILTGSPTFMFIVFSVITVVPVMLGVNKSTDIRKNYRWLYWMLFLFIMFPQTFNALRQGAAVSIGFYLIVSILESRKLFRLSHLIYLLLAVSFHASAWILLPISYVAHRLNNTRKKPLTLFIIAFSLVTAIGFSILPQLLERLDVWSGYLDITSVSRSVVPRSLLILLILMMCWKFYGVLKIRNSYTALLWMGLLASIGGLFVAYFERIGYYINLLLPLLLLVVIAQSISRRQMMVGNLLMCSFALGYFIVVYYFMGSSDVFPYNWGIL